MLRENLDMFKKLPELETNRLLMRKMLPRDSSDMFLYASDDNVTKYLTWESHRTPSETYIYLASVQGLYKKGEHREWALINKENMQMIGTCGFTSIDTDNSVGELGYVLNRAYHGMGYAKEAAEVLMSIGFCYLGLERIEIKYIEENTASRHVAEKCHMTFEGVHHHSMFIKGEYKNIGICAITRDEYFKYYPYKGYEFPRSRRFFF